MRIVVLERHPYHAGLLVTGIVIWQTSKWPISFMSIDNSCTIVACAGLHSIYPLKFVIWCCAFSGTGPQEIATR